MPRNTKTKNKIKNSFVELINDKGFSVITISDITRKSEINRGTFYLHYKDKYDLLDQIKLEAIHHIKDILSKDNNPDNLEDPLEIIPYSSIIEALIYVKENINLVRSLASEIGDSNFLEMIKSLLNELLCERLQLSKTLNLDRKDIPLEYANEIIFSSTIAIILMWIKTGGEEQPEEIAQIIMKARTISPYEMLSRSKNK